MRQSELLATYRGLRPLLLPVDGFGDEDESPAQIVERSNRELDELLGAERPGRSARVQLGKLRIEKLPHFPGEALRRVHRARKLT